MRRFLPILILAIGAGGLVALVNSKPQREALEAREKAWVIDLLSIEPATVTPQLSLYGRVRSPTHRQHVGGRNRRCALGGGAGGPVRDGRTNHW